MHKEDTKERAQDIAVSYYIYEIKIRNFKSIREVKIPVRPGINVLVGRNASGKTNILEAIYFLYKSLVGEKGKVPYRPHTGLYWSGLDAVYKRQEDLDVELGVSIVVNSRRRTKRGWRRLCTWTLDFSVVYRYDKQLDTLKPEINRYVINGDTQIDFRSDSVTISISKELFEEVPSQVKEELESGLSLTVGSKRVSYNISYTIKYGAPPNRMIVDQLYRRVFIRSRYEDNLDKKIVYEEYLPAIRGVEKPVPLIYRKCVDGRGSSKLINNDRASRYTRKLDEVHKYPSLRGAFSIVDEVIGNVVLLKHPDIGTISRPVPFRGERRLDMRASNLADVILTYQGLYGSMPLRIGSILGKMFPRISIKVQPVGGSVVLVGEEDGVELPPPNLPDGLIKAMAIAVAMDLGATLLLIDGIESNMHAELLRIILDEADTFGSPVIVATHSPIVVDLAGPDRILVVKRDENGDTMVEKGGQA